MQLETLLNLSRNFYKVQDPCGQDQTKKTSGVTGGLLYAFSGVPDLSSIVNRSINGIVGIDL